MVLVYLPTRLGGVGIRCRQVHTPVAVSGPGVWIPSKKAKKNSYSKSYCWWKKSCTSQYAGYHVIYKIHTLQVVLAHLSTDHITLFDLFACSILGMIIFLNPSEGEARIPKNSYMADIFSAKKMDPYHSTSWNVSQGFWWNLGPLLTWLSFAAGPTRSIFHPKQSSCGFPNSRRPPKSRRGLRRDMKPEGCEVRLKKKNKGPLGGGNSNILYFHPYILGEDSHFDNFQLGWNHQLGLLLLGFV